MTIKPAIWKTKHLSSFKTLDLQKHKLKNEKNTGNVTEALQDGLQPSRPKSIGK